MARRPCQLLVVLVTLVAFIAAPLEAVAAPPTDIEGAKIHFQAGKQYYDRGLYDQAIFEFREAYRLSHLAALLYNISQAHERMGALADARDFLQQYLDSGKAEAGEIAALQDKLHTLDRRIAEQRAAAAKPETKPASRPVATEPEPAAPVRPFKTWKWVALASGGAVLILAGIFALDGARQAKTVEEAATGTIPFDGAVRDSYNRGRLDNGLAIGFGVGGAAIAAVGVVFFVLDAKRATEPTAQLRIAPVVGPGIAGASAAWRF